MKASTLVEILFRMAPYVANHDTLGGIEELLRSGNDSEYQIADESGRLSAKDYELLTLKKKMGAVIPVVGARGSGKTELAYRLAQFIDKPTFAVSPEQHPHPTFIKQITLEQVMEIVPPGSTVIYDDMILYASSKDYSDALIRQMERDIQMCRHYTARHIIFVTQNMAQADRYVSDCDMAFFKPEGLLVGGIERPHIAKYYKELVDPAFDGKSDSFIQRHAYMLSRSFKGLVSVRMVK